MNDEYTRGYELGKVRAAHVEERRSRSHARRPDPLPHDIATRLIEKRQRFRIQDNTVAVLQSALRLKARFQTSYWDAAILAAAKAARCQQLLTEDLNHGQDYDGVVVVNPF
jgi:predicted nucleic acid-binding protein